MDSLHLCNTTPLLKTFKLCLLTAVLFIFTITTGSAIAQAVRRPLHSSHIPAEVQQSRIVGHLDRSTRMNLSIGLPLRNQEELNALLTAISDPSSPDYKHYLTPQEFADRFGPTQEDYDSLTTFALNHGLTVTNTHSNRLILDVAGDVPDVERAFNVNMVNYSHPTRGEFYAPDREPSFELNVPVEHIGGLSNYILARPMSLKSMAIQESTPMSTINGSGASGLYFGKDFRKAYAPDVTLTGAGQTVALVEFDGFYASDIAKSFTTAGYTPIPVQTVLIDNATGIPGKHNDEVSLDITMAAYMAPGLKQIIVYEGGDTDDVLNRIATDNSAAQISSSWGFPISATTEAIFKQFILQGQTFFNASGDYGSYNTTNNLMMPPSDNPNITSVGGTSLATTTNGLRILETAWLDSGGGVSPTYAIPSYQQGIITSLSGGSTTMRNIPDVAALSEAIEIYADNGTLYSVVGTSASAPLWAGFLALANQQAASVAKPTIGFLNPIVYAIGQSDRYSVDFNDISQNEPSIWPSITYPAEIGFDLVTGWGSPTGQQLINDLIADSKCTYSLENSVSSVILGANKSGSDTISIIRNDGFSGTVSFTVSGLPNGVTAAFSATSTNASSTTVTLTTSASTLPGTYPAVITGTSGALSQRITLPVIISPPGFSLVSSAVAMSIQNSAATATSTTITVTNANNLPGPVALTVAGLPSGVTATFNQSSTSTTSILSITPSANAALGSYTVTVQGISGALSSTTTFTLLITSTTAQSFSLLPFQTSLTITNDASAISTTIYVMNSINLTASVSLTATNLPTGITATFSPSSTSTNSTLTFTSSTSAIAGTYTVKITGISGNASNNTSITLVVTPALFPGFSLNTTITSVALTPGGNPVSATIGIANEVNLGKAVTFSVSGLPVGVTAVFGPTSTSSTSTLTFTPATNVVTGTYTVIVTGTYGAIISSGMHITIIIKSGGPSFTLSVSNANLSLMQSSSASVTISVINPLNLTVPVTLSTAVYTCVMSYSFSPVNTTTTSVFTLVAGDVICPGNEIVTITGTSGSATNTVTFELTTSSPPTSFNLVAQNPILNYMSNTVYLSDWIGVENLIHETGSVCFSITGLPAGVLATFSFAKSLNGTMLSLTFAPYVVPGTYTLNVIGVEGSATSSAPIVLVITGPSFALSNSNPSMSLIVGGASSTSNITVFDENGFNGPVAFTASGVPAGVTAIFSSSSSASGSAFTLTPKATATPGTYAIVITGTTVSYSTTTTIMLTVIPAPSFTLTNSTPNVSIVAGGASLSSAISITGQNNFSGTVSFTVSGLPAGVTAAFSPSSSATGSTLTLTASTAATPSALSSFVIVTGKSGNISATTAFFLTVTAPAKFTLSPATNTLSTPIGGSAATSKISVVPANGFTGTVSFVAVGMPAGITASFSPTSSTSASTVSLTAGATAVPGSYTITITGTSVSLTASTTITVEVPTPIFTVSSSASTLNVSVGSNSMSSTISILNAQSFNVPVTMTASSLPTGVTAVFSPATTNTTSNVSFTASATAVPGAYAVKISGTVGGVTNSTTVNLAVTAPSFTLSPATTTLSIPLAGNAVTSKISVVPTNGFIGTVTFAATGLPTGITASFSPTSSTSASTVSIIAGTTAALGPHPITIIGTSGTLIVSTTITITVQTVLAPSFTLSSASATLSTPIGGIASSSKISVIPANGFTGAVAFTVAGLPSGMTASFSPTSSTSASTVSLTAAATATSGPHTITITGTSGTLTASTSITVTVPTPSFTLSSSVSTLNVIEGGKASAPISVLNSLNFSAPVTLAASSLPAGVTAAFSPATTNTTSSVTFSASASATPGTYSVKISGTVGGVTNSATISLTVPAPSFTLVSSSTTLSTPIGESAATSKVSINSINGFAGSVNFTITGLPAGITASFSPASSTSATTVSLNAAATAACGSHTITITGTSGSLIATTSITVTVPVPSFTLSLSPNSITVVRGSAATKSTITIVNPLNFGIPVTLTAPILPAGVTATFGSTTTNTTTTISLSASPSAKTGTFPAQITGTAGVSQYVYVYNITVK